MIAEAAQVPDNGSLNDMWSSVAFDPHGARACYHRRRSQADGCISSEVLKPTRGYPRFK
jgi:hypothetical protein